MDEKFEIIKADTAEEATIPEDYAEELADLTRVWRPEPDTAEEARL